MTQLNLQGKKHKMTLRRDFNEKNDTDTSDDDASSDRLRSTKPAAEANTYRQITMQEAVEMMEKEENYIILDVRTHEEFAAGHIPGAIVIPNETIGTEEIAQLPDIDQLIMVYCRSGNPLQAGFRQAGEAGIYQYRRIRRNYRLAGRGRHGLNHHST